MAKTATVSLFSNRYEVDPALVGRKVELVFDPFDLTRVEVRYNNRPMGAAVPVVIGRHSHPAARPEPGAKSRPHQQGSTTCTYSRPSADAELTRRIYYAGIAPGPDGYQLGLPLEQDQEVAE